MKINKRYVIYFIRNNKFEYLNFKSISMCNFYQYVLDKESIPYVVYEEYYYEEY